jgi:hypothetical protein
MVGNGGYGYEFMEESEHERIPNLEPIHQGLGEDQGRSLLSMLMEGQILIKDSITGDSGS